MGKLVKINASVLERSKFEDENGDTRHRIDISSPIEMYVDVDDIRLAMRASRIVDEAVSAGVQIDGDKLQAYFAAEIEGTVLLFDDENLNIVASAKNNHVDWSKFDNLDDAIKRANDNYKIRKALNETS